MAGQEQQPVDNNLLFPIAPSSGGDPSAADDAGTHPPVPSPLSDEPAGLHDAIDIPAPPQAADTALEQQAPQDTADTDQPAANESGVLPGDIVDTNWNIPLITFPTWGSLLDNNAEQDDNAGNKTGHPADESAAQDNQVAPQTVFTPFVPSEPEPDTQAASTQDTTKSKTEQWLNAAAQDRGMHETQQINAVQPDPSATAVAGISQTASGTGIAETAALNNSAPATAQTQPVRQSAGPALLTPPTPSERDLQHERTANAETETMTPISSAAVVAGTAAIAANVAAPGAVKTTATRTLHTTSETPTPANDAVGSLSEELREEDARAASQPIQPEESYGDKRNKGGRARSRVIVTVFVIITIAAAAAGLYYLTGLIRTNRDRSSAYASCTQAYSAYKEESETLAKTLKTSKAQQKVGADQVADVMTVEHLKTAVDKAKSVSKPVTCSTSMSTEAMRKAAETNKTLTTELTGAKVDVAIDHGSNRSLIAAGLIADKLHILDAGRLTPVILKTDAGEIIGEADFIDAVRAAADGLLPEIAAVDISPGHVPQQMLGQDHGAVHTAQEQRIRFCQLQRDHIAFHAHTGQMLRLTVLQRVVAFHVLKTTGAAGIGIGNVILDRESDIFSRQGFTVMPLHSISDRQCEFGVILIVAPFCCQCGHMFGVGSIPIHQRVKHHVGIQALLITGG